MGRTWLSVPKDWIESFGEITGFLARVTADVFNGSGTSRSVTWSNASSIRRIGADLVPIVGQLHDRFDG